MFYGRVETLSVCVPQPLHSDRACHRGVFLWSKGHSVHKLTIIQWIGLRENLQETMDFPIKYGAFL
jgi:hypothetical protein